jgi:hypothetical protein
VSHPEPLDSMIHLRYWGLATFVRLLHVTDTRNPGRGLVGVAFDAGRR